MAHWEDTLPANDDTILMISGLGFQYSARGLTQTLFPISQTKQQKRTIDGTLVDVSNPAMRKYGSKISCTDTDAPPLDGLWPGMEVTVQCAIERSFLTYKNSVQQYPSLPVVSGSLYTIGPLTLYRPELVMLIMDCPASFEEWKHDNGWSIDLEQV